MLFKLFILILLHLESKMKPSKTTVRVLRVATIQQCKFCGKLLFETQQAIKIYHNEMCFPITSPICWPPYRKSSGSCCLTVSLKGAFFFKSKRHMLFTSVQELNFTKAYYCLLHQDLVTCYNILFMQSETCMPIPTTASKRLMRE